MYISCKSLLQIFHVTRTFFFIFEYYSQDEKDFLQSLDYRLTRQNFSTLIDVNHLIIINQRELVNQITNSSLRFLFEVKSFMG